MMSRPNQYGLPFRADCRFPSRFLITKSRPSDIATLHLTKSNSRNNNTDGDLFPHFPHLPHCQHIPTSHILRYTIPEGIMGARENLQRLADKKQQEIEGLQAELDRAKIYLQAIMDSIRVLPKEVN